MLGRRINTYIISILKLLWELFHIIFFRGHWRLRAIFKKATKVYEVMFFGKWKYVYSESVFNTFYTEINIKVEKLSSNKINGTKKCSFFLLPAPTYHSFTFNLQFLHELKHKVRFSKIVRGIFHSQFRFVFIKFYVFVQQNAWSFVPRPLIFNCNKSFWNSAWVGAPQKLTWWQIF